MKTNMFIQLTCLLLFGVRADAATAENTDVKRLTSNIIIDGEYHNVLIRDMTALQE